MKPNGKNGRPPFAVDWDQFDKLCGIQCTLAEMALWFRCTEETLILAVKRDHDMRFSEYYEHKKGAGRIALRRLAFHRAQTSDALLIFLLKNHLGMTDRQLDGTIHHRHSWIDEIPEDQLRRVAGFVDHKNVNGSNVKGSNGKSKSQATH